MKKLTVEEMMSIAGRELGKLGASKGGKARQAQMTDKERKAHSALMNKKRWSKQSPLDK